jgi:protein-tyrosine phosphatase
MKGFVDLHSHWVPGIDDGVRSAADGVALLQGLRSIGFDRVVATPHMRPGLFDNDRAAIERAYATMLQALEGAQGLPEVGLSSEHFFDDVVYGRLVSGQGLPYPGGFAALVELHAEVFPVKLAERLFDMQRKGLRPVLAHPERYAALWERPELLDPVVDGGTLLLLDVASLSGKYGRRPEKTAAYLLEEGYYYAACSDAHRPADVDAVASGIARLERLMGREETEFLLSGGPKNILRGVFET